VGPPALGFHPTMVARPGEAPSAAGSAQKTSGSSATVEACKGDGGTVLGGQDDCWGGGGGGRGLYMGRDPACGGWTP
jgi:hypothetical protein